MFIWQFVYMVIYVPRWKILPNSWTFWHMFTKFDTEMHLQLVLTPVGLQGQSPNNQATTLQKSQDRYEDQHGYNIIEKNLHFGMSAPLWVAFHIYLLIHMN